MNLNAIDIKSHSFRTGLRGYNPEEVDAFLELVAEEVNRLQQERKKLSDKNENLSQGLQEIKKREKELGILLHEANNAREHLIEGAKKDAERIIEEAKVKAVRMILAAERKVHQIEHDIQALEHTKKTRLEHFRSFLKSQLSLLDELTHHIDDELSEKEEEKPKETEKPETGTEKQDET